MRLARDTADTQEDTGVGHHRDQLAHKMFIAGSERRSLLAFSLLGCGALLIAPQQIQKHYAILWFDRGRLRCAKPVAMQCDKNTTMRHPRRTGRRISVRKLPTPKTMTVKN